MSVIGFLRSVYIIYLFFSFIYFVVSTLFKKTTVTKVKKNWLPAEKTTTSPQVSCAMPT